MEEIVKLLDENLKYVKHEVSGDRITIWVKTAKKEVICSYCGKPSKKDIQGMKEAFKIYRCKVKNNDSCNCNKKKDVQ